MSELTRKNSIQIKELEIPIDETYGETVDKLIRKNI
jgi:hypothetical protein